MRRTSSEQLKLWKGAWEDGVATSLESPRLERRALSGAAIVAGAAMPRRAPCAAQSASSPQLQCARERGWGAFRDFAGENTLPTYHLSSLWSETKQSESSGFRKSKCESQGRPGRSLPEAVLTPRENAAGCPPGPLRRRAEACEQTQPSRLVIRAKRRFPSYPVPACHPSPPLKEWGMGVPSPLAPNPTALVPCNRGCSFPGRQRAPGRMSDPGPRLHPEREPQAELRPLGGPKFRQPAPWGSLGALPARGSRVGARPHGLVCAAFAAGRAPSTPEPERAGWAPLSPPAEWLCGTGCSARPALTAPHPPSPRTTPPHPPPPLSRGSRRAAHAAAHKDQAHSAHYRSRGSAQPGSPAQLASGCLATFPNSIAAARRRRCRRHRGSLGARHPFESPETNRASERRPSPARPPTPAPPSSRSGD